MSSSLASLGGLPNLGETGSAGLPAHSSGRPVKRVALTRRQKVAVIVRLLVGEGAQLPLADWPEDMQEALTQAMGQLRRVDRESLEEVVEEFSDELQSIGLSFSGGIEGALGLLDGHISPATSARLRREAGVAAKGDPWERIGALETDKLQTVLEEEGIEVGAVLLSMLPVSKSADLLGKIAGDKARRITHAMQRTSRVAPETIRRIGLTLAAQLDSVPVTAFDEGPAERVAAVLNFSPAATRDDMLAGLQEQDAAFAELVKKAIFTFANIPERVAPRDVPKVIRSIDQAVLVTALAGCKGDAEKTRDFILDNMSKRMAENLRDEMAEAGKIKDKVAEEAMTEVVTEVRRLESAGDILFVSPDDEEEEE